MKYEILDAFDCIHYFMYACSDGRCFSTQLASRITGSVEQMMAKNKWGLYLVGAGYVTVSSGFILGERVHSELDPQSEARSQKLVTCFSKHRPVVM